MRALHWLLLGWILCGSALGSTFYVVRKGDTLYRIGLRFHVSTGQLAAANRSRMAANGRLKIGQRLLIPGRASPSISVAAATRRHPPRNASVAGRAGANHGRVPTAAPVYLFLNRIMDQLEEPYVQPGRWKYIVVHHSGTPSGNARIFDYFHRHVRGMENGLAYHFVIGNGHDSGDGEIEVGSRWRRQIQGGHLHSDALNRIAIGICFVGDFNRERPTQKQIAAALELIGYLNRRCGKPPVFKLHREINPRPTQCPGRYFPGKTFHQIFDQ